MEHTCEMVALSPAVAEIKVSYLPTAGAQPIIRSSKDAYDALIGFFPRETIALQERFIVGYLNRANALLGVYELSVGGISGTVADPKLVLGVALRMAASSIILCHNHPSGNLKPSRNDEALTKKLQAAAHLLELQVVDHLIVTPSGDYYSWADQGLI